MLPTWIGFSGVIWLLAMMIGGLKILTQRYALHPELARKLLHVGMGLVILPFPWIFDSTGPVFVLAGSSALFMAVMRSLKCLREGVGSVLTGVDRDSWGEVYYPLAVGILFGLTQAQPLLFVIPVLILSLADATAALVGMQYGQIIYSTCDGCKSLEGSIGFFVVAFLSVHVPLLLFSSVGRVETLLIALVIALLVMLLEGIAWQGLDNLSIPLGSYLLLHLYMDETPQVLLWRLVATVILAIFALAWRGRSSLDDSALLGAALFGYAAWMLGGWLWLLTPLSLFLLHVWLWPADPSEERRDTVPMVLATVFTGLLWLSLYHWSKDLQLVFPYGVSFGIHLATIKVSRVARTTGCGLSLRALGQQIYLAWGVSVLPLWVIQGAAGESWLRLMALAGLGCVGIALAAGLFNGLVRWVYDCGYGRGIRHGLRTLLAALGSATLATSLWI